MTYSSSSPRVLAALPVIGVVLLLLLTACKASVTPDAAFRTESEAYIAAHIGELSTRSPVVGGTFHVTKVEWIDDNTARVSFEDGHIALIGRADVSLKDGAVVVSTFRLETQNESSSSSMAASSGSAQSSKSMSSKQSSAGSQASAGASAAASVSASVNY